MNVSGANFRLDDRFIAKYAGKEPQWGPLGYITYKRTYARQIDSIPKRHRKLAETYNLKVSEEFWLTLVRVVEGTYRVQESHCKNLNLPWQPRKAQRSAQEMYRLMWEMKFLPPGRGLWMMGTQYIDDKGGAPLNNPLGEQTLILTKEYGWIQIGEIEGQQITVLSNTKLYCRDNSTKATPKWVQANISHSEYHPCSKITYRDKFSNITTVIASQNHRWFRRRMKTEWERVSTEELKVGDYLPTTKHPEYHYLEKRLDSSQNDTERDWLQIVGIERITGTHRVLCATVPEYEQFVIEGNCLTSNCAFTSTRDLKTSFSDPFCFLMDMSMLGVGVGADTKGAGTVTIKEPKVDGIYKVEDSREGWVDLLRTVLDSYVRADLMPSDIDVSNVRPAGAPIRGFGGISSGPKPLLELIEGIKGVLNPLIGETITSSAIVDIFNLIGRCVVFGNIRRSAEIMFGDPEDQEFIELKDPKLHPEECRHHRWASNNSLFANIGMDYSNAAERTAKNGEPGYEWLDNARRFSRMKDPPDNKDMGVAGANPCVEQSLEDRELCCLVETFPSRHKSYEEYERTLKFAYLYAKTVTLIPTHDARTNAVVMRNRRIGTSQSGIIQAFQRHGRSAMRDWCNRGYMYLDSLDKVYSRWLCIPESVKKTSVKPSGSISLLPGVTPGIHYPHSEYYYRVIRFASDSPLIPKLLKAGYRCVELDPKKEPNTTAVYFAVKEELFDRAKKDVTMWEQLENAAFYQAWWADNQVSCTVTFKKHEAKDIKIALQLYETRLKGISFLPLIDHGYEHAPYQEIDEETYLEYTKGLKKLNLSQIENEVIEKFCDGDTCMIPGA